MLMDFLGKTIIVLGIILIFVGTLIWLLGKLPFLGKLPGDIYIKKENFSFYAPITTMLILSLLISLILNIFSRLGK